MKTKRSVYIIVTNDGKAETITERKDLVEAIENLGLKNLDRVYRAVPLEFRVERVIKLGTPKPASEESKSGPKNDKK